jgi:hypothetical protein
MEDEAEAEAETEAERQVKGEVWVGYVKYLYEPLVPDLWDWTKFGRSDMALEA